MSDHRTWGETKNCKGCRFWSEMLAHSDHGPLRAACLAPHGGPVKWTTAGTSCALWQEGSQGAVDDPGGNPYEEEAAA